MIPGPTARQKVDAALEGAGGWIERHANALLGALLLLFFVALVGLAANDYLWYDELVILRVARLPDWHAIWNFYASGLDTIGLMYALLLHAVLKLPADAELSSRLPAIVMFLVMLACVFVFVRRRYAAVYAFAVVLLVMTYPFLSFAVFAKSYTFELAGFAFAMICWQRAMDGRSRGWNALGVWCGLALAIYSHSFAIFFFVPFAAAQLWSDVRRKKVEWPMWAALLLFPGALLPVMRGALRASKLYGANFWSKPSSALMKQTYIDYFLTNWRFLVLLLAAGAIVSLVLVHRDGAEVGPRAERAGFSKPEWLFVVLLALLPAYVLPASYLLHAYRADYVVAYAIGVGILLVCVFAEQGQRSEAAGAVVLLLFAVVTLRDDLKTIPEGLHAMAHPRQVHERLAVDYGNQPWVKLLEQSDLPVLAGDHLLFTRLDCYAPPDLRDRLYFLTNIGQVKQYSLSETSQRNFLLFGAKLGYRTMDVGDFLPEHRHFLMAVSEMTGTLWLPQYVLEQQTLGNATLQFEGPGFAAPNVYDVRFGRLPSFAGGTPQS